MVDIKKGAMTAAEIAAPEAAPAIEAAKARQAAENERRKAEQERIANSNSSSPNKSDSGNSAIGWIFLILGIGIFIMDIFVFKFNGIDIVGLSLNMDLIMWLMKTSYLSSFVALLIIQLVKGDLKTGNKELTLNIIKLDALLIFCFIMIGGTGGGAFHLIFWGLIWWFLLRSPTKNPVENARAYDVLFWLLFIDFLWYPLAEYVFTLVGVPVLAEVFGNRLLLPIVILYPLHYLNKPPVKSAFAGWAMILIVLAVLFGTVLESITIYGGEAAALDQEQLSGAGDVWKKGIERIYESILTISDSLSCSLSDPMKKEQCVQERYYERHPEEKEKIDSQKDLEKYPSKVYFRQTSSNQRVDERGFTGIDTELYVQGDSDMDIEIECEMKMGEDIIYSGKAEPSKYPKNMIGLESPKNVIVTCKPEGAFPSTGRYTAEFTAYVKRKTSIVPLKRVIVTKEEWLQDFSSSPYSKSPYGYKKDESARAEQELAALVFNVGSQTLLGTESPHKISGYFGNFGGGRMIHIHEYSLLLNSPLLVPSEGCNSIYAYDSKNNEMELRDDLLPTSFSLEKVTRNSKDERIPQCNIRVDVSKGNMPSTGGMPVDIESRLVYDYRVKTEEIPFTVYGVNV